ncbi:MAG: hypothetical protein ACYS76_16265 [Planctomycetota bacterium]|jgi:hypothetical protein
MEREDILSNAKRHCFFIGLNDSGAELCKANAVYGIAGTHCVQRQLGLSPDATFISTPDMTITRNTSRWGSGFGYGGKISWGPGDNDLIILDVKPNACGMLVGGLEQPPDIESLIRKLHRMETDTTRIDGVEVAWDFYKSNHFIDIFEVKAVTRTDLDLPPYAFAIHGSATEFRGDNELGFGLYYDRSRHLHRMAEHVPTPFGEFHILRGDAAKEYFEKYRCVEDFAKKKRKLAAELLFGESPEISNETHQGLINPNEIALGCHYLRKEGTLFPLTLRGDLPAYIVWGKPNLSPESIDVLGFEKRAKKLGVYERLLNANIIPHGGGYVLPDILTVNRVVEVGTKRYFEVEMHSDRGRKMISEVRELPYEYRGRTVVLRALEIGIIEIVAKLIPQYVLKI